MNETYRHYIRNGRQAGMPYRLALPRSAPTGLAGVTLANRSGSSLEFMDHRDYQPGDDLRRIDWNAYARSDRLTIKLYREEVTPHLDIVIDGSRSMALEDTEKAHATLGLAAALAQAAVNSTYSHCTWITRTTCHKVDNATGSPETWDRIAFDDRSSPSECFTKMAAPWRPHGIRIFLSDLLWLGEPLTTLAYLAERSAAVFVVQILARDDVDPPERGNLRLIDSETDVRQEIFLDAVAEQRYRDNLARHQQHWHRASKQLGAVMTTIVAETLVDQWSLDQLVADQILRIA